MAKPFLAFTKVRCFLLLATRFAHISGGILSHSSLQILSKSLRFRGWRLATPPQIFYGMKVWRLARPLQDLNVLLLEQLLCCLGCVLGHCHTGIPIHDPFSMPWLASMPWPWRYMAPSIIPLMQCSCPVPLFWSRLTTTLSPSSPLNHLQTSDGTVHVLSWVGGPCGRYRILVLHGVVCYQLFSWWLWSQLPWDHWQDPPA